MRGDEILNDEGTVDSWMKEGDKPLSLAPGARRYSLKHIYRGSTLALLAWSFLVKEPPGLSIKLGRYSGRGMMTHFGVEVWACIYTFGGRAQPRGIEIPARDHI